MQIDDLHTFPPGHPPSPLPLPVVQVRRTGDRYASLAPTLSLRAVGWLGAEVPTRGGTSPECIDSLVNALDSDKVIHEGMRGYHSCEVCEALGTFIRPVIEWRGRTYIVKGKGHHLVQLDQVVYVCPQLTLHYIFHHDYRPPDEFVTAAVHGRFLTFEDLAILPQGGAKEWFERPRTKRRR